MMRSATGLRVPNPAFNKKARGETDGKIGPSATVFKQKTAPKAKFQWKENLETAAKPQPKRPPMAFGSVIPPPKKPSRPSVGFGSALPRFEARMSLTAKHKMNVKLGRQSLAAPKRNEWSFESSRSSSNSFKNEPLQFEPPRPFLQSNNRLLKLSAMKPASSKGNDDFEIRPDALQDILSNRGIQRPERPNPADFLPRTSLMGHDMFRRDSSMGGRLSGATPLRRFSEQPKTPKNATLKLTQYMSSTKRVNFAEAAKEKENTPYKIPLPKRMPAKEEKPEVVEKTEEKDKKTDDGIRSPNTFSKEIQCMSPNSLNVKLSELSMMLDEVQLEKEAVIKKESRILEMKSMVNHSLGAKSTTKKKLPARLSMISEVTERDSLENNESKASSSRTKTELFPKNEDDNKEKPLVKARRRSAFKPLKPSLDDSLLSANNTIVEEDSGDESTVFFVFPGANSTTSEQKTLVDMSLADDTLRVPLSPIQDLDTTPVQMKDDAAETDREKLLLMSAKMPKTPVARRPNNRNIKKQEPENFEASVFYDEDTIAAEPPIRTALYIKSTQNCAKKLVAGREAKGRDGSTPVDKTAPKPTPTPRRSKMNKAAKESNKENKVDLEQTMSPAYNTRSRRPITISDDSPSTATRSYLSSTRLAMNSTAIGGFDSRPMLPMPTEISPITIKPPTRVTRRTKDMTVAAEDECDIEVQKIHSGIPRKRAKNFLIRIPNPIAQTLTHGDEMRFVPIRSDSEISLEL